MMTAMMMMMMRAEPEILTIQNFFFNFSEPEYFFLIFRAEFFLKRIPPKNFKWSDSKYNASNVLPCTQDGSLLTDTYIQIAFIAF